MNYYPTINAERCISCQSCVLACGHSKLIRGKDHSPSFAEEKPCFGCMHCVTVCPCEAIEFESISHGELYGVPQGKTELERLVMDRRSTRYYQQREDEALHAAVQRAIKQSQWAPYARNARQIRWLVMFGAEKIRRFSDELINHCREQGITRLVREDRNGTSAATFNAPCLILAAAPYEDYNPPVDTAIAMTTLELLLHEQGLGTCWLGYMLQLIEANLGAQERLGLTKGWHLRCGICAGYPGRVNTRRLPWRPEADIVEIV